MEKIESRCAAVSARKGNIQWQKGTRCIILTCHCEERGDAAISQDEVG